MKLSCSFLLVLIILSCNSENIQEQHTTQNSISDSLNTFLDSSTNPILINNKIEVNKDSIVKKETTLRNGYFFENKGIERDGYYVDGKKHGIFRTYYSKKEGKVMLVSLYQNDSSIWNAHPAADIRFLIPIKEMNTSSDSTLIRAPHFNGNLWYEGHYNGRFPYGIHRIYHLNGKLRGIVNYKNDSIIEYDTLSNIIFKGTMSNYWKFARRNKY